MKLLLTSAGLGNTQIAQTFSQQLNQSTKISSALVIAYAKNNHEQFYVDQSVTELKNLGLLDVQTINLSESIVVALIEKKDVIYVCGGNTFAILQKMRQTGVDKYIVEAVSAGAFYVGVSAGSIIAGPSIELAGWGSEADLNEVGLTDLAGFNFTNIAIFPHYHPALADELNAFKPQVNYPIIPLTDTQALLIKDGEEKLIEGGEEYDFLK